MSTVLLLTGGTDSAAEILPSLTLLPHAVKVAPPAAGPARAGAVPPPDVILVDARRDLVAARRMVRALREAGHAIPVLVVVTEGGWPALAADWGADDAVLNTAGPGEVEARLRMAAGRATGPAGSGGPAAGQPGEIRAGRLVINEAAYSARLDGRSLDLTFKEFELLKFLTQQPGRVFTRAQLLQEVWGYDYFGGTRTVDVHVRRLRAKLGAENEALIGTVRNVGYRFVPPKSDRSQPPGGDGGITAASANGRPGAKSRKRAGTAHADE
ncbi:MAG TPA: response regulator transcription factor [Streptosporangiaceae bacterium]